MKTRYRINPNQKTKSTVIRLSMIIAGIITAVVVLLALTEPQHALHLESTNSVMGISRVISSDFSLPSAIGIAGKVVASVWPF